MMRMPLVVFLLALRGASAAGAASAADAGSNAAVQKVIQMLSDMQATAKKEKQEEAVKYAEFETFCKNEIADLKEDIKKAAEQIELLTSEIEKLTSDVAGFEADLKAQTAQREKDHADFVAESTDFSESIDAIERALGVLKKQTADIPQG